MCLYIKNSANNFTDEVAEAIIVVRYLSIEKGGYMLRIQCGPTVIIPPSWIIEEERKRKEERRKPDHPLEPLPLSLPELEYEDPAFTPQPSAPSEERVVVIDL